VKIYRGENHTRVIGSLASSLRFLNPAFADIERFLRDNRMDRVCRQGASAGAG